MVRTLIQSGTDPNTTTAGIHALRDAASPLGIARERDYDKIVAIIREEEQRRKVGRPVEEDALSELRRALEARDDDSLVGLLSRRPDLVAFQMPLQLLLDLGLDPSSDEWPDDSMALWQIKQAPTINIFGGRFSGRQKDPVILDSSRSSVRKRTLLREKPECPSKTYLIIWRAERRWKNS